jgi:hypothetical protein
MLSLSCFKSQVSEAHCLPYRLSSLQSVSSSTLNSRYFLEQHRRTSSRPPEEPESDANHRKSPNHGHAQGLEHPRHSGTDNRQGIRQDPAEDGDDVAENLHPEMDKPTKAKKEEGDNEAGQGCDGGKVGT